MNKKEKELRILLKKVGKNPEVMNIENTLKAKQKLVNGLIEVVPITNDILLICNEEGKLDNLPPNLLFDYDYIAGDDFENSDFKSLTDEQIEEIKKLCKNLNVTNLFENNEKEID